jgi:hypothetical protein
MNALQKLIAGMLSLVGMFLICLLSISCGSDDEATDNSSNVQPPSTNSIAPIPVPEAPVVQITSFSFPDLSVVGRIDQSNGTIDVTVPFGTDISSLTPVITTTEGATVSPASDSAQSFLEVDRLYTVRDSNYRFKDYTVTVWIRWNSASSPRIAIVSVPNVGQGGSAIGEIAGVRPSKLDEYQIALYIKVRGGWWVKPYFGSTVEIHSNGVWHASVTTGGDDVFATQIRAYLVPASFGVPQLAGSGSLPDSLDDFPYDNVDR